MPINMIEGPLKVDFQKRRLLVGVKQMMCENTGSIEIVKDRAPSNECCLIRVDQLVQEWLQSDSQQLRDNFNQAVFQANRPKISSRNHIALLLDQANPVMVDIIKPQRSIKEARERLPNIRAK